MNEKRRKYEQVMIPAFNRLKLSFLSLAIYFTTKRENAA
jgi:hypothetical protein